MKVYEDGIEYRFYTDKFRNGYFIHEVAHITDRVISALGNKLSEK